MRLTDARRRAAWRVALAAGFCAAASLSWSRGPHVAWPTAFADPPPNAAQPAPGSINAEVMVLHATNANTGIDPKIGKIPALSKPPFSSYNSYKLLTQSTHALPRSVAQPVKLPTGRELDIVYKEYLPPAGGSRDARYVVAASIQKADGKSFLPLVEVNAKPGDWFWVGGQEYSGGALFIGIKISP